LEIRRGARIAARATRVLTGRLEVHDTPPALDRFAIAMLIRGQDALEVQRPDVFRIESQHPSERDSRIGAPATFEQRLA
jgi:hypothetical protein